MALLRDLRHAAQCSASRRRPDAAMTDHGASLHIAVRTPYAASVCELTLLGGKVLSATAREFLSRMRIQLRDDEQWLRAYLQ